MPISALPFGTPETWHAVSISSPGPTGGTTEGTPFTTVESYTPASSPTIGIGGVSATAVNLGNSGSTTTVAGALNAMGALTVAASGTALNVTNNAAVGGTLGVAGAATFSGGLAVTGSFTVNGQLVTSQSGSYGTAAYANTGTSGATLGTLSASKTDSGANVYSAANIFSAPGTALSVTNNAAIGGTLEVTGAATISGGASITGLAVAGSLTAIGLVTPNDLATQAANTVLTNASSGSASPTAQSMSSCSAPGNALNWTTNTGFGCNPSITAAAVPATGLTGTTLPSNVTTSSLTSAAGGSFGAAAYLNTGTSGATLGMLNASKTDSGANTYSGAQIFSAPGAGLSVTNNASVGGTASIGGMATVNNSQPIITNDGSGHLGATALSFASHAALTAYQPTNVGSSMVIATTAGYVTAGDNGGGTYVWTPSSSAIDASGTFYVTPTGWSGNGRWVLQIPPGGVSIKIRGAICNGTTDDLANVTNLIATGASVYPQGLTYVIPPGATCYFANTVSLSGDDTIVGQGTGLQEFTSFAAQVPDITLAPTATSGRPIKPRCETYMSLATVWEQPRQARSSRNTPPYRHGTARVRSASRLPETV